MLDHNSSSPSMYYGYAVTSGMFIIVRKPVYERYETEVHS